MDGLLLAESQRMGGKGRADCGRDARGDQFVQRVRYSAQAEIGNDLAELLVGLQLRLCIRGILGMKTES